MNKGTADYGWGFLGRVGLKVGLLFLLCNLLVLMAWPLEGVGRLSLYNGLWAGRERLPYGENTAVAYNLSLHNIPAMFASHRLSQPPQTNEARVILLGDSGTWGWFLRPDQTLAGQMNALAPQTSDGRNIISYNLGYPIMSASKDLLLLEEALKHNPDLIVWLVTLESLPRDKQLFSPLVQNNAHRIRPLISQYGLQLDPNAPELHTPTWAERTLIGQRRPLADLLRLQQWGLLWTATGIDQEIPAEIPPRQNDLTADTSWQGLAEGTPLTEEVVAWEVLAAGIAMAEGAGVPLLLINEPMFVADGANSEVRYNSFYPRWAYATYRAELAERAEAQNWLYRDWWDVVPADEFTDTPVHLSGGGTAVLAKLLVSEVQGLFDNTAVER
jgi:hypothetical protein